MTPFAILLVLGSTFMHAGWNLLARRERAEATFMGRMLIVVVGVGFLPAIVSETLVRSLPPRAWACVLGSGVACGLYYFFLARAYASSDFTIVYPLARALPVLLVGIADVFRGRYPTLFGWLGLLLVVIGCLLTPLLSFRDLRLSRYLNRTNLWILFTALGTVGYTLLDKIASEVVLPGPATAARYGYIFFVISYLAYALLLNRFKGQSKESNAVGWRDPIIGAGFNFGAYWLVLWVYQFTHRASYVVAFRQFSIVIGVLVAFAVYRERGKAVRLTGTFLITTGLVIIALWGR